MDFENVFLPTYVINLKARTDRYRHVQQQFADKPEFDLHITEACTGENGSIGLWKSIVQIINTAIQQDEDLIILCEDDHTFTPSYNRNFLFNNIIEAGQQGAEILSGGIGGFNHAVPLTANRYWVDYFGCGQFLVLYRPLFAKILAVDFRSTDTVDGMFSEITSHKMVIYPFISVQIDFGYSDVTEKNNQERGLIDDYFRQATVRLGKYQTVYEHYLNR